MHTRRLTLCCCRRAASVVPHQLPRWPAGEHDVRPPVQIDRWTDRNLLSALGVQAVQLLCSGDIRTLADRFGYALAYGRDPAGAIRDDLKLCLAEVNAAALGPSLEAPSVSVTYFEPNDTGLLAAVECVALAANGAKVFVDLVVTGNDAQKHVTLEHIHAAA